MKRTGTSSVLLIILAFLLQSSIFSQDTTYSKLTLSFDPVGFLFFGPSVNMGYSLNSKTVIKLNVRPNSWGLLARKIRNWDGENELYKFTGVGFAIGANKYLTNVNEGYYYGAFLSVDIQNTKYSEGSEWSWHEKTITYGLLVNGGKRIKLGSRYYIDVGGILGFGIVSWKWDYDDPSAGIDDPEERKGTSAVPIGSLECAFGVFLF